MLNFQCKSQDKETEVAISILAIQDSVSKIPLSFEF